MISLHEITNKADKFRQHKDWYTNSREAIVRHWKSESNLFIDLLAITSKATSVRANVTKAIRAFSEFKESIKIGIPTFSGFSEKDLISYFETGQIRGPKIEPFAQALKGDLNVVVVDRWIWRLFYDKDSGTDKQRAVITSSITEAANEIKWFPSEVQASLWAAAKDNSNGNFRIASIYTNYLEAKSDEIQGLLNKYE